MAEIGGVTIITSAMLETPWSVPVDTVPVTSIPGDVALPSLVLTNVPAGVTVFQALAYFKFHVIENTNILANSINGAQNIQIKTPGGLNWTTCIALPDGLYAVAGSTREGGDVLAGTADVSSVVKGNGTYNLKWTLAQALQNNLNFDDVQVMLRVWYG
jgi:hypothetical protein